MRFSCTAQFFSLACLLCGLPVLLSTYPPMVDVPQHAAQIMSLKAMLFGDNWAFSDLFEIKPFTPYWLGYGIAMALSVPFGIVMAVTDPDACPPPTRRIAADGPRTRPRCRRSRGRSLPLETRRHLREGRGVPGRRARCRAVVAVAGTVSDAGHMTADVGALGAALVATRIATRKDTTGRRTCGSNHAEVSPPG